METAADSPLGSWAVVERATGTVIGTALLIPFLDTHDVEVGYHLARSARGRGFATEAAIATIRHGFETTGLPRIVAVTYPENTASQRVLENAGPSRQGVHSYRGVDVAFFVIGRRDPVDPPAK